MPTTSIIAIILGLVAIALVAYEVRYSYLLERYEYQCKHTLDLEAELILLKHRVDKYEAVDKMIRESFKNDLILFENRLYRHGGDEINGVEFLKVTKDGEKTY